MDETKRRILENVGIGKKELEDFEERDGLLEEAGLSDKVMEQTLPQVSLMVRLRQYDAILETTIQKYERSHGAAVSANDYNLASRIHGELSIVQHMQIDLYKMFPELDKK